MELAGTFPTLVRGFHSFVGAPPAVPSLSCAEREKYFSSSEDGACCVGSHHVPERQYLSIHRGTTEKANPVMSYRCGVLNHGGQLSFHVFTPGSQTVVPLGTLNNAVKRQSADIDGQQIPTVLKTPP